MDQLSAALPEGLGIRKIHHVAVIVRDMEASLGLYRDMLGLPVETLNSAADFFVERIDGWRQEIEIFRKGSQGTIFRPTPTLFLLLKLGRLSEQDLDDCLALIELAHRTAMPLDRQRLSNAVDELPATGDAELAERRRRLRDALRGDRAGCPPVLIAGRSPPAAAPVNRPLLAGRLGWG